MSPSVAVPLTCLVIGVPLQEMRRPTGLAAMVVVVAKATERCH